MKIEKNGKYTTRDGREFRIYETDGSEDSPIHGAIKTDHGTWIPFSWKASGAVLSDSDHPHPHDLVPYTPPKNTLEEWFQELSSPEEWFQELPSPIRERAIANIDRNKPNFNSHPSTLEEAVLFSFYHSVSPEGEEFWREVERQAKKPASERNYPALPDGKDDFGNVVPAELLPLPEAPEVYKRKYEGEFTSPIESGFHHNGEKWLGPSSNSGACGYLYIRLVPEKKYWSEPSHFPAQAWIMRPHWEGCAQITKVDWRLKKIHCAGYSGFDFDKLPECRWSERMFSSHNEGKECVVES